MNVSRLGSFRANTRKPLIGPCGHREAGIINNAFLMFVEVMLQKIHRFGSIPLSPVPHALFHKIIHAWPKSVTKWKPEREAAHNRGFQSSNSSRFQNVLVTEIRDPVSMLAKIPLTCQCANNFCPHMIK